MHTHFMQAGSPRMRPAASMHSLLRKEAIPQQLQPHGRHDGTVIQINAAVRQGPSTLVPQPSHAAHLSVSPSRSCC